MMSTPKLLDAVVDAVVGALSSSPEDEPPPCTTSTPGPPAMTPPPSAPPANGGSSLPYPRFARILPLRASETFQILAAWRCHTDPLPAGLTFETMRPLQEAVDEALRPALNNEIIEQIERLRLHYGEWDGLSVAQAKLVGIDWLFDFEGYPILPLWEACAAWRNSARRKPPTAGQLKELGDPRAVTWRNVAWKLGEAQAALLRPDRRAR
jgi:hypothetical protein